MLKLNKLFIPIIFLFLQISCFCQIGLTDAELQKRIIGKWVLVSDDITDRAPAYHPKNDTTFVEFFETGLCKGYLVDPFKKYNGSWEIKKGFFYIKYNESRIDYGFVVINDTSLILTTHRSHIGSCIRTFTRNLK